MTYTDDPSKVPQAYSNIVYKDYQTNLGPVKDPNSLRYLTPPLTPKGIEDTLRNNYPGGHPDFIPMTVKEVELHARKNTDYAKGGDPLGNFHRVASILSLYPGLDLARPVSVALVYMLKQLDAALYMLSKGYEGQIEGIDERLTDVHVYAKLARILAKEKKCN